MPGGLPYFYVLIFCSPLCSPLLRIQSLCTIRCSVYEDDSCAIETICDPEGHHQSERGNWFVNLLQDSGHFDTSEGTEILTNQLIPTCSRQPAFNSRAVPVCEPGNNTGKVTKGHVHVGHVGK